MEVKHGFGQSVAYLELAVLKENPREDSIAPFRGVDVSVYINFMLLGLRVKKFDTSLWRYSSLRVS